MLKKTITFKDFNDVERTENFYFNLTQAEVTEMELGTTGGLAEYINKIIETKDGPALIAVFKDLILRAYGEKSPDGRRFMKKNGALAAEFAETQAYSNLYMELATDDKAAAEFINGIVPAQPAQN